MLSLVKRLVILALGIAFLANCGGGGGATPAVVLQQQNSTTSSQGATQQVSIALKITAAASTSSTTRSAQFVSPGTNGVLVQVYASPQSSNPNATASVVTDVSSGSAACGGVSGTRTCTIYIPAPVGLDDFVFTTYDQAPVSNAFASSAHVLAVGRVTQSIVGGQTNAVNVALGGNIATLQVTPVAFGLASGAPGSSQLAVTGLDADGFAIIAGSSDPYNNPVTVTVSESGGSGFTSLTTSGAGSTGSSSITLTKSTDVATVLYTGGGASGYFATFTVASQNVTSVVAHLYPLYVSPAKVNLVLGASQTLAISETNFAGTFTLTGAACANVVNFAGTVPATNGAASIGLVPVGGGSCSVTISDGKSSVTVAVTVTPLVNGNTTITIPGATTFNSTATTVSFIVPATGPYQIVAAGAQGGTSDVEPYVGPVLTTGSLGGLGAQIGGNFMLNALDVLSISVGQRGSDGNSGGGGGGTFIYDVTTKKLLVAAGGGGGGGFTSEYLTVYSTGGNGLTTRAGGSSGVNYSTPQKAISEPGGSNGAGGVAGSFYGGGGGGGFLSNGLTAVTGYEYYGDTGGGGGGGFPGLAGGVAGNPDSFALGAAGGFGGGGGSSGGGGGGGGYSGGGGGNENTDANAGSGAGSGGGGGSYVDSSATSTILTGGVQSGNGQASIAGL